MAMTSGLTPEERRSALRSAQELLALMSYGDIALKDPIDNLRLKELLAEFIVWCEEKT